MDGPSSVIVHLTTAGPSFVEDLTMDGPSSAIVHLTTVGPLFGVDPIMDGRSFADGSIKRRKDYVDCPHLTGRRRRHPQSSGAVV